MSPPNMNCDICCRGYHPKRIPFFCAVDARNQIYEDRFKHLQITLEADSLRSQISELLANTPNNNADAIAALRARQATVEMETSQIVADAEKLKKDIQGARDEFLTKDFALARNRADLATATQGLPQRQAKQLQDVERSSQKLRDSWSQSAEDMASCRAFLCAEAANLYGLERVFDETTKIPEYRIGKVSLVDLTKLNTLAPEVINASLGHISHLLMLASHYLAIRLPAEITLPHRDYPHTTIYSLTSSYKRRETPSQNSTASHSATDPGAKRLPRPRPLHVDKPLHQLLKDDSSAYSFFLEGVTLLAYNITWLSYSQGTLMSENHSFEDICQMGRNLYNLLIESQQQQQQQQQSWIGRYSHGTIYYSLAGAEGTEITRAFKLPSPRSLADKLKKKLVGDAPAPDWELLEDDAWQIDDDVAVEDWKSNTSMSSPTDSKTISNASNKWTKIR